MHHTIIIAHVPNPTHQHHPHAPSPICLPRVSPPDLPRISAGARPAAVPALRIPMGHGGPEGPGGRDPLGAGTPLRTVPVPLPVHQRAPAVQTARQVQVLQFSALGDGI